MTQHDDRVRLRHMLDYAQEAVELAKGHRREELDTDRLLKYALIHLVEVLGEAAGRVSEAGQRQYPDVALRQARAMRNRLIHGYDMVDPDILWDTIHEDLPTLITQLHQALGQR